MQAFILVGVIIASLALVAHGLSRPGGYLALPFQLGGLQLLWIAPQFASLMTDPAVPQEGLDRLALMIVLCSLAALAGWRQGVHLKGGHVQLKMPPDRALWFPAAVLTAIAVLLDAYFQIAKADAIQAGVEGYGIMSILWFLASIRTVPLALSLYLILRRRTMMTISLFTVNALNVGAVAFLLIRRTEIIDFSMVVLFFLFVVRRITIPRAALLVGALGFVLVVYSISALRMAADRHELATGERVGLLNIEVLSTVDFKEEFNNSREAALDLRNAAYLIDYSYQLDIYGWGGASWNRFIWQYVPATFVGRNFKESLVIDNVERQYDGIFGRTGFQWHGGTTSTGYGFSYQEFALLGCLFYWPIGFLMGRLWLRSLRGDIWAQLLYAPTIGLALVAYTHHPMAFYLQFPLIWLAVTAIRVACSRHLRLTVPPAATRQRSSPFRGPQTEGWRLR
ncbi:MAG: hypothetical protein EOS70_11725 [Mesorhizobium sp.]|uniref:hypothetical protein n=1 Tax=Mesorhizobium sp. TaxID=1871066 RepID=UPI000FE84091|nr:hypothetical protein [Mesorhizobium sp.]RWC35145.1 MAG: hypothetical protein EOS70_11725 [Mesorhizobium sp.]